MPFYFVISLTLAVVFVNLKRSLYEKQLKPVKPDQHGCDVPIEPVQWLWYPYIPIGKLTMVQGDPGDGKTTFVLAVIAALTKGEPLPECSSITEPMNVIYQTAEDGLSDTIKPRLVNTGRGLFPCTGH